MKKKNSNFINPYQDNNGEAESGTPIVNAGNANRNTNKQPKQKTPKNMGSGKPKLPLILGIVGGLIVFLLVVVFGLRMMNSKTEITEPEVTPPSVTEPVDVPEPPIESNVPSDAPEEDVNATDEPDIVDVENPKYSYENDMLGLKFNFNSNLYMKENVADIFNVIKGTLPEGRDDFNIYSDKLPSILNIVKLTTGNSDGLYVSISLLPFEIEKETTTLKIDGTTEVLNESIESINLTDDELIDKYDTQIKQGLMDSNCEIISYDKSSVLPLGSTDKVLKGILTSRVYKDSTSTTTSTGIVDVIQCTIPLGKNAILITAVTDGSPIEIDKSEIFYEIINSLVVLCEGPIVDAPVVDAPVITEKIGG